MLLFHVFLFWNISLGIMAVKRQLFSETIPSVNEVALITFNQASVAILFSLIFDPSPPEHVLMKLYKLSIFAACQAHYFYYVHRMLHTQVAFENIHFFHHEIGKFQPYHSFYCSPLEHLCLNMGSFMIGPLIFGCDTVTLVMWVFIMTCSFCLLHTHNCECKQGYTKLGHHHLHQILHTVNFSSGFTFVDEFNGTFRGGLIVPQSWIPTSQDHAN